MTMVAGLVVVDDDGTEHFTPDDATNYAKQAYLLLLAAGATVTVQQMKNPVVPILDANGKVIGMETETVTKDVEPTPVFKQAQAKCANLFGAMNVPFFKAQATVTVTIPASAAGDGLQVGQGVGAPTTHPATPKTITGVLT